MPNGPYSSEVKGKLVTGNSSLISISSLSKRSLLGLLTSFEKIVVHTCYILSVKKWFYKDFTASEPDIGKRLASSHFEIINAMSNG